MDTQRIESVGQVNKDLDALYSLIVECERETDARKKEKLVSRRRKLFKKIKSDYSFAVESFFRLLRNGESDNDS